MTVYMNVLRSLDYTYNTQFIAWIRFLAMLKNNLEITNVNVLLCFIASIYLSMAQRHW